MKRIVAVLVEPGRFEIVEEEVKCPADGILIRNRVCGLCTWELNHWEGRLGEFPQRIGHEAAGEVIEIGRACRTILTVGDKVTGFYGPGFATVAAAGPSNVIRVPEGAVLENALGEPLSCIVNIIRAAQIEPGDFLGVVGCGGMGLLALSLASHSSLAGLFALDTSPFKLEVARELGASTTLQVGSDDVEERLKSLTDGRMLDVVIESTDKPEGLSLSARLLRQGRGRLVIATSHNAPVEVDLQAWEDKGILALAAHPPFSLDNVDDLRRAVALLARGIFPVGRLITHRFPLEKIQEAFETYSSKPPDYIKGIVTM